jgi:uncharacterized small protein (DUF1192 family)
LAGDVPARRRDDLCNPSANGDNALGARARPDAESARRQAIYKQQQQIQGSLGPLGREGEEGALRSRYVATLGELENRLAALGSEEPRLSAENARLEQEANKQLAALAGK